MSSTTTTEFYGLTQYVGTDKPSFTDNNEAFRQIDGDLHTAVTGVASQAETISELSGTVSGLSGDVTDLGNDLGTEKAKIVALQDKEVLQDAAISGVKADALDMICAYNEATATSTHAYAIGDYFRYNDILYKASSAIEIGDTIVPNVNCVATNVSEELLNIEIDTSDLQPKEDNSLDTTSKEIVGAINEVNAAVKKGSVSVTADGVKTRSELLDSLFTLVDSTKLSKDSAVVFTSGGTSYYLRLQQIEASAYIFARSSIGSSASYSVGVIDAVILKASGSIACAGATSGTTTDNSSSVDTVGDKLELFY